MSIHVVLVHPEIHWNTGNAGRTCLAAGATLHLIEPLGFSLDEAQVKRAGLDYWEHVDVRVWPNWEAFEREMPRFGAPFFFETNATQLFWDASLAPAEGTVLVFGRETGGLPAALREQYADRIVALPMTSERVRSLNLSTTVAVAVYEVLRQGRVSELGAESRELNCKLPREQGGGSQEGGSSGTARVSCSLPPETLPPAP